MSKIEVKSENRPMQTILPSFVTIVTFCHEIDSADVWLSRKI